jgi:NitT/TauT family transport system permease protein
VSLDSPQPAKGLAESLYAIGLPAGIAAAVVAVWQAGVMVSGVSPVILPAPADVLSAFDGTMGELVQQSWATGSEALLAFLLSCTFGLAAAIVLSSSVIAFEAFYPNLVVFQIIPKIALAPLFTFWLGIAAPARLTYAVFISFFPVALSTMTGLARANTNALRLCRALGASRWQTFFAIKVPYSLPYFFSGAKIAATMSVIGIVVGEFISADQGLGYYILRAQSYGQTPRIFAALVFLSALGLLLYLLPMGAERLMRKWWYG